MAFKRMHFKRIRTNANIISITTKEGVETVMHYTQRLRDTRTDKDQSQEEIAKALDITRQQYQLYESGKRKLPIDKLKTLCLFYGVSADYILGLPRGLEWPR